MTELPNTRFFTRVAALILAAGFLTGLAAPAVANDKDRSLETAQAQVNERGAEADNLPTITLSAPANNTESLYPALFNVTAAVSFPGEASGRDSKRHGVEVEFLVNGQKFAEAERAPYLAMFTPPAAGIYTVTAQIRYGEGRRTILSAPVTVVSDLPPVVSLTGSTNNIIVAAPATFTLSASATAPIGSIAKVELYNGSTLIGTATTAPYTFHWVNVPWGTYSVTAKATDNYGFTATTASVTLISNQPPTVSIAGPSVNSVSVALGSFTLSANAADVDGTVAKVDFYANNGTTNTLVGTATAAPYSVAWTNIPAGKYALTAVATDNYGASTTSSVVPVVSDAPPTVNLTGPASNAASIAPGSFNFAASASSQIGSIAKVDFYAASTNANGGTTNTLIGTATAAPYTYAWTNVASGSYTLTAVATDNWGIGSTSGPVNVTVKPGELEIHYIHTDYQGTPRSITDIQGNVVWQWTNADPFGNNMPNDNPSNLGAFGFNMRLCGQYFDRETNLAYHVLRDYDPSLGRYVESNPFGLMGGINTYGYASGNPMVCR